MTRNQEAVLPIGAVTNRQRVGKGHGFSRAEAPAERIQAPPTRWTGEENTTPTPGSHAAGLLRLPREWSFTAHTP